MALLPTIRPTSVTVTLATGKDHGVLPGNKVMEFGTSYTISWEDWERLSPAARKTVLAAVPTFNFAPKVPQGTNLNLATGTVPSGYKRGQFVEGFDGAQYRLLKNVDMAATQGWALARGSDTSDADDGFLATGDRVGGVADSPLAFAGVVVSDNAADNDFVWLQTDGIVAAVTDGVAIVAGKLLRLHPTTDGVLQVTTNPDEAVATAIQADSGARWFVELTTDHVKLRERRSPDVFATP